MVAVHLIKQKLVIREFLITNKLARTVVSGLVSTIQQVNYSSPDKYYDQYFVVIKWIVSYPMESAKILWTTGTWLIFMMAWCLEPQCPHVLLKLIVYILFFFIAKGLNLYQKLAPNSFSYVDGYISAINRNVHSLVHERVRRIISFVEYILLTTKVLINNWISVSWFFNVRLPLI